MSKLILFDIDDTIINTVLFRTIQDETLANYLGVDDLEVKKIRSDYYYSLEKGSDFFIDDYLKLVAKKYHYNFTELKEVFFNQRNIQLCLYEEVFNVLKKLKNLGFTLGTFSEGWEDFQRFKLERNHLIDFFDKKYLYLLKRKLDKKILTELPAGTIIVDDKPEVITELKKFKNIKPIQIIRPNKKNNPQIAETIINNFEDLLKILL